MQKSANVRSGDISMYSAGTVGPQSRYHDISNDYAEEEEEQEQEQQQEDEEQEEEEEGSKLTIRLYVSSPR
jgi:ribosomal protein L12E/L44/L45/RPP1/RPP2